MRANQELPLPLASSATFIWRSPEGLAHFKTHNVSAASPHPLRLRLVNYAAPHYPGILTWSYPGHPYPLGQAWTTEGLCLSWHHLPTDKFNPRGQITSELIWQLLNNVHDVKSMQAFLKTCQVFGALSIIVTDQQGALQQVILEGQRKIWRHPRVTRPLYFNRAENLPLTARSLLRPIKEHYQRQKSYGQKFLAQQQNLSWADFWPAILADRGPHQERYPAPFLPLTTTAISAVLPQEQRLCLVDLTVPRPDLQIFPGPQDFAEITGHRKSPPPSLIPRPPAKLNLLLRDALAPQILTLPPFTPSPLRPFLGAMLALQNRDHQGAASYFALAAKEAEGPAKNVTLFFQSLNQYFILPATQRKAWAALKQELRALRPKLPRPLQDHAALFIWRINTILENQTAGPTLQSPLLRRVWRYEQHLPPAIFLQVTRFLTQLRPDILEIIYPHAI